MTIKCSCWMTAVAVLLAGISTASADVRLPEVISNNMVLQKDIPLPIWGWAAAGEEVTVTLGESSAKATADGAGKWKVILPSVKIAGGPHEMIVKGKNEIKVSNILIGEVWAGSGQSNMQWNVAQSSNGAQEIADAKYPKIRLFVIPLVPAGTPSDYVGAKWVECTPNTVAGSSAVLYFFGREIHQKLDGVPVGLITTAWGGTRIQPWIPPQGYTAIPELEGEKNEMLGMQNAYADQLAGYAGSIKTYVEKMRAAKPGDALPPVPYYLPLHPLNNNYQHTGLYNGMIHPIVPFGIRGFLWYQGESNNGQGMHYYQLQRGLIEGWRSVWNQEGNRDFPFLFAQLAPYNYQGDPTRLAGIWEAQTATLAVKNTGMAVLTDITTLNDIHPPNKQEVGRRLSLWALANTYGQTGMVFSGPLYKSIKVDGSKAVISFNHAAGLKARDGKDLSWWSIAGDNKKFVKASAKIEGDTVVVSAEGVTNPVAVRFGWHHLAEPNLANGAGLPASPFRTDTWTDAENANP